MGTTTRQETIAVADGEFGGHLSVPERGQGPGLVLIQEVFGVNRYIHDVGRRLAELGYVSLAPDLFWRLEPGVALDGTDSEALSTAMGYAGRFDAAAGLGDLAATLRHLRGLDEVGGPVGVIGFCFGGTFAFLAAAQLDPACAVSYYGSGVAAAITHAPHITCPILFHFGSDDPYLPMADVETIQGATDTMPNVEVLVQPGAGHAFDNSFNPNFSNPEAAANAWQRTTAFLEEHLT